MANDLIADLLTRIRNAQLRNKEEVIIPFTKSNIALVSILKQESYIEDFSEVERAEHGFKDINVVLKYNGEKPAITMLERVSKPGLRKYVSYKKIPRVLNGLGISVISTPKGIMTGENAKQQKAGGEYICNIW